MRAERDIPLGGSNVDLFSGFHTHQHLDL